MTDTRELKIGVRSYEEAKRMTLARARGTEGRPADEPSVWVTSLNSIGQLLSPENLELLALIDTQKPASVAALADIAHRATSNVQRTLSTMESYGLVSFVDGPRGAKAPQLACDRVNIVCELRNVSAAGR